MTEENGRVVERILKTRQSEKNFPTWDEIMVIEALGERYLKALDDPGMLDIALSDLGAIKEMRPDLKDHMCPPSASMRPRLAQARRSSVNMLIADLRFNSNHHSGVPRRRGTAQTPVGSATRRQTRHLAR